MSDLVFGVMSDVEGYLDKEELRVVTGTLRDLQGVEGTRRISNLVEGVARSLGLFVGYKINNASGGGEGSPGNGEIAEGGIGRCGKSNGGRGPCTCGSGCNGKDNKMYTSSYKRDGSSGDTDDKYYKWDEIYKEFTTGSGTSGTLDTLARILLGAIPLVFSGLSYLYYTFGDPGLDSTGGKTNDSNTRVGQYMQRMGYQIQELVDLKLGKKDEKPSSNVFKKAFEKSGILGDKGPPGRYADYLDQLRKKAEEKDTKEHSLLKLNVLCSGYFRSLHTIDSIRSPAPRTPRTIREILYWLTSLPYCPIYRTLVPKVQEMIRVNGGSKGKVVFYGSDWSGASKQLEVSAENCASYLLGAALVAPLVLLGIQDTIESRVGHLERKSGIGSYKLTGYKNNVPIHDLYANMQFKFTYPMSETQSYYLLQDCLVALYYQLYFLECQTYWKYTQGYGWGYCKYGDQVECTDCKSWICPVGDKGKHEKEKDKCGKDEKSPLQAFLCDCLKEFTCPVLVEGTSGKENLRQLRENSGTTNNKIYHDCYPEFLSHRGHTSVFGQECAVPMGFSGSFRSSGSPMSGLGINAVLDYYATSNMSMSGLYQITRCICSLTRRVPRSTGTLYGFFYGLGLVYGSKTDTFKKVLLGELRSCPGWRNPECLMGALMGWTESDHSTKHPKGSKEPANPTLGSLYMCNNETKDGHKPTCGKYLRPLTGYLYNCLAPEFCETYVSWIVHLTGVLKEGLESLLKEFVKIDCSKSGCSKKGSGHCCQGGTDHGTKCQCKNVVDCVGVHGLFYRFGFTYSGPSYLADSGNWKRQCKQFYERLNKVLTEKYFQDLSEQLRNFMYSTRALFGVYIGVYWLAVLGYLVYSMAVNLDILHIQSHWRSTSSYLVPLQRLLAEGSRKGFCTLGYFQEVTGDSLLSQGVSDVYL